MKKKRSFPGEEQHRLTHSPMPFDHSDTSGTDDDLPPSHPGRLARTGKVSGNGRTTSGTAYGQMTPDQQIRKIEQDAYTAVLRAFIAQSEHLTWAKEGLMSDLRKELRIPDGQHREILGKVSTDATLRQIREWRQLGDDHVGPPPSAPVSTEAAPNPLSASHNKKQKTAHVLQNPLPPPPPPAPVPSAPLNSRSSKSKMGQQQSFVPSMPVGPSTTGRTSAPPKGSGPPTSARGSGEVQIDAWIGRRVKLRWPEDNAFYEAVITDYDPEKDMHALTYEMNADEVSWEWVKLKELSPRDLKWVDSPPVAVKGQGQPSGKGGVGKGSKKVGGKTNGRSGVSSPVGRTKGPSKGLPSSIEKNAPHAASRIWRGSGPPENGLDVKASRTIQLPPFEALVKEVDKIAEEDDLGKLECAKRAAKEHEEMIRRALVEIGESSDDGDSDDHGQPPSSRTESMQRRKERRSRQDSGDQHGEEEEDDTAGDEGRGEGSEVEAMAGEGAVASDDDEEHLAEADEDG